MLLSAVVKGKENRNLAWKENADVISTSINGAGFYLSRQCRVGRLVSVITPHPVNLRCYDYNKRLYRIWGLVQHCNPIALENASGYHVSVAFIGKEPPDSYQKDPAQSYRILGMNDDGLWDIDEAKTPFMARRHARLWKPIDVSLVQLDDDQKSLAMEETSAENISVGGASIISHLDVSVGDQVKFRSTTPHFSTLAIVRNRHIGADERPRLSVEFVESAFPVTDFGD